MNIMVTGGLGHIGSALVPVLWNYSDNNVHVIDNLVTQRYPVLFEFSKLEPGPIHFTEADIIDPEVDLDAMFQGMDVVIHLAALTDAVGSIKNPDETYIVNCRGTERVARACVKNGCKLIFVSTTSVYGPQDDLVTEASDLASDLACDLAPQSPYAYSKLAAETALYSMYDLDFVVLRFGTIYGPSLGMRFHTAVNKFIWHAVAGSPITIWKEASNQQRPYLDLKDAVSAIEFILSREIYDKEIYNVVTKNNTPNEIVQHIADVMDHHLEIDYVDAEMINQQSYRVSSRKLLNLGFVFQGNLSTGISDTFELLEALR